MHIRFNIAPKPVVICLTLCISLLACSEVADRKLRIGTTTTLEDSGLLVELIQRFNAETDIVVTPIVAGSGQIHALILRGELDSAITHAPEKEKELLLNGDIEQRLPLMQNDFLFVGDRADPAHIQHSLTPDEVLKKIRNTQVLFVSRADESGTHLMEQYWWQQAGVEPKSESYLQTGTGMGQTLAVAAERGAYTLVDRATWEQFANKQSLVPLFEDDELLQNIYSIISVPISHKPRKTMAQTWEQWLLSSVTQDFINGYRINDKPVFFSIKD